MKQFEFGFFGKISKEFGGNLLVGKRKSARPLSTKHPLHLILKSTGSSCFAPGDRRLERLILDQANKYGIKVFKYSFNWSHVHLAILLPSRESYLRFIRTVTAKLVYFLSKKKGINLKGFFDLRPFTEILSWGRQMRYTEEYFEKNDMEARGMYDRKKHAKKKRARPVRDTA